MQNVQGAPVSLLPALDPAEVDAATVTLGGNRAAAVTLLSDPEAGKAAVVAWYRANQIKRLGERQKLMAAARKATVAVLRAMQDEPRFRERGEYVGVWSDLLARVDADIVRDTADLARLKVLLVETEDIDEVRK